MQRYSDKFTLTRMGSRTPTLFTTTVGSLVQPKNMFSKNKKARKGFKCKDHGRNAWLLYVGLLLPSQLPKLWSKLPLSGRPEVTALTKELPMIKGPCLYKHDARNDCV